MMKQEVTCLICDEMVDPLVDKKLSNKGPDIFRPEPSESDKIVLNLSIEHEAPILTRDKDFIQIHRKKKNHLGIIFDPRMHYRTVNEIISALESVFELMDKSDLKGTIVRLNRFY